MDYFLASLWAACKLVAAFDPAIYRIVWTSLYISLSATLLAAVPAVPLGVVATLAEFRGKILLQQVLRTLMAMPTVMVGLIFYGLLSRRGPLGELGLLYTPAAVIVGEACLILPIVMNLTVVTVQGADARLVPTLLSLGASFRQLVWWVARETRLGIAAAVVMGFGRAIGEVGTAMMLGGNIQGMTRTMTTAIALETSKGEFELGLALGMVLLLIAFTVNGAVYWLEGRRP